MGGATFHPGKARSSQNIVVERYEGKYLVPPSLVQPIREFIAPFCIPDPNTSGFPPEYVITTLQLDTPDLALHRAKSADALDRFKLRVRTYGLNGNQAVFLEIKRKTGGVILKSRAKAPHENWSRDLVMDPRGSAGVTFRSPSEEFAFIEFCRLVRQIGAEPKILVRYTRESYVSSVDEYARVTLDRNLLYQPTDSWTGWGAGGVWRRMDVSDVQNREHPFSALVLELKSLLDVPTWLMEIVDKFDLVRLGNCKYSSAVWVESVFGSLGSDVRDIPTFASDWLIP